MSESEKEARAAVTAALAGSQSTIEILQNAGMSSKEKRAKLKEDKAKRLEDEQEKKKCKFLPLQDDISA